MKIIEAMKGIKANKEKISDLQKRIASCSAQLSHETPLYGAETRTKISEWQQACLDTARENVRLLVAIQRTNLQTLVGIKMSDTIVSKSISEWVWRRREYAALDMNTWAVLSDRGLREGMMNSTTGQQVPVTIIRNYDPATRDEQIMRYKQEPHLIDAALEVVNATTDLIEA